MTIPTTSPTPTPLQFHLQAFNTPPPRLRLACIRLPRRRFLPLSPRRTHPMDATAHTPARTTMPAPRPRPGSRATTPRAPGGCLGLLIFLALAWAAIIYAARALLIALGI